MVKDSGVVSIAYHRTPFQLLANSSGLDHWSKLLNVPSGIANHQVVIQLASKTLTAGIC